jgi:hypothetical protein
MPTPEQNVVELRAALAEALGIAAAALADRGLPVTDRSERDAQAMIARVAELASPDRHAGAAMNLPKHICLSIEHNPHRGDYETVERWLELNDVRDAADISPEDRAAILASGEVWTISWCPDTPVGSCTVAAATLERALEIANKP